MKQYRIRLKEIGVCETFIYASNQQEAFERVKRGVDWGRKPVDFYIEDLEVIEELETGDSECDM